MTTFTKTPPTEPGKYYWKRCIDYPGWFVRDLISMGRLGLGDHGELLESIGGLWGGRVPAPGTTYSVEEFQNWIHASPLTRIPIPNKSIDHIVKAVADTKHGIAAVTDRHRKEQG